ncbi:MAG: O-antigen ligase family protein [Candidatus Electrothrix scaldis]|nr:MAG: O-antigen ligase family protein [Candidatus Electrothrix sp. GW3-3]
MRSVFDRSNNRFLFELFFIFLIGIFVSRGVIQAAELGGKWENMLLLVLIGAIGLLVIPDREKFLLYFSAILLPINLTIHPFGYNPAPFYRLLEGFQIRAIDFPLALILLFWLIRLILKKEKIRLHLWMTIPYLTIVVFCITSWIGRPVEPVIKAGALLLVLKNLILFLYLANNLKERRTILMLVGIFLLNGSLQALIAMAQYLNGGAIGLQILGEVDVFSTEAGVASITRVGGTIGHANKLALFLAFIIEINIALLFVPASRIIKVLRIFPLLLMCSAIMLTYSRSAWASLILGGTISVYWCRVKQTGQRILSAFLVIALISGIALSAIALIPSVRNRIFEDDRGSGLEIRHHLKVICNNIIVNNYWLGVGLNNYCSVIHKYDISELGASWHFPMPVHNEYMLVAAELGVPAAIIFIILLLFIIIQHISVGLNNTEPSYSYLAIGFLCGWIGWLLHHRTLFEYSLFSHNIWFYLGIVQAMKNNLETTNQPPLIEQIHRENNFSLPEHKLLSAEN